MILPERPQWGYWQFLYKYPSKYPLVEENITEAVQANLSIELHNLDLYRGKSVPSHIPLVKENLMRP